MRTQAVQRIETTDRRHRVAIVSDGSSSISARGGLSEPGVLPQLHARAALFDQLAEIDAIPMCVQIRNVDRLVNELATLTSGYPGVLLAEMASPRCLIVRERLGRCLSAPVVNEIGEPAAVVVLAAVCNALAVVGTTTRDAEAPGLPVSPTGSTGPSPTPACCVV